MNATLSNDRVGIAVILDAANGAGYVEPEVKVLVTFWLYFVESHNRTFSAIIMLPVSPDTGLCLIAIYLNLPDYSAST